MQRATGTSRYTTEDKASRLSWDPDNDSEGCKIFTPSERRLVDINTTPGLCLRKLCTLPITSRNCNLCAFHGKHFVPCTDRFGRPEPGSECLNYTFLRLYKDYKRLCGCQNKTCFVIGYSGEGSFQLRSPTRLI
jgi:hypothetical protein